jgi:ribosome biogenesis GTPase
VEGVEALIDGTIIESNRGQYRVETADGVLVCTLRGRLRKQLEYGTSGSTPQRVTRARTRARDPVAVGDKVRVRPLGGATGVIEEIVARSSGAFIREDAGVGRVTSVAGLDQIVAVFAARDPVPHLGLLDRFLVLAESQDLAAVVCLNKIDLGVGPALAARLDFYAGLGYPVVQTCAVTGTGLDALRAHLAGKTSALLGPSGVGKSHLLNALEPGLSARVGAISQALRKGRHTTTGTQLVPLTGPGGGALADTAGIRALALGGLGTGVLAECFPEFMPYLGTCAFSDCSHRHEPGCQVQAAVATGAIDPDRYDSYCKLYAEGADAAARAWEDVV